MRKFFVVFVIALLQVSVVHAETAITEEKSLDAIEQQERTSADVISGASFIVDDIQIEGLQRVSAGTIFKSFPIQIGDKVDRARLTSAMKSLFKTALFKDIDVSRDGSTLIISVVELPTISRIEIKGNSAISEEDLKEGLAKQDLAEGKVFKRSTLEQTKTELERQYVSQNRYNALIQTTVVTEPRNRVALIIKILEGEQATVKQINIVGNKVFPQSVLLKNFNMELPSWWKFWSKGQYSRQILVGDLERLRSFYLDRGYLNFNIESTQVSISPDKEGVYVTINVSEGEQFTVNSIELSGDFVVEKEELEKLVVVEPDTIFSRKELTTTSDLIKSRLGDEGFSFARVNPIPKPNADNRTVDVTFYVEPGKRTYVRRIRIIGNENTNDEVLRRELLQMEGGWASNELIEESKMRIQRLGYFKEVTVEKMPVPGTSDQIDVEYHVTEELSGSISASVGYQTTGGITFGITHNEKNFLGTGRSMNTNLTKNTFKTDISFSYLEPYYTVDGISRGYDIYYLRYDYENLEQDFSRYNLDKYGASVNFGFPLNNNDRLRFDIGLEDKNVEINDDDVSINIKYFVEQNGENYDDLHATLTWTQSTLNGGIMANRGTSQRLSLYATSPFSDQQYYKLNYKAQYFMPVYTAREMSKNWSLRFHARLGYGDGYGDTKQLPFYDNMRVGGSNGLRGYRYNSLGPKGLPTEKNDPQDISDANVIGGNIMIAGGVEFLFPMPLIEDTRSLKTFFFYDFGNVYTEQCLDPYDERLDYLSDPSIYTEFCHEGIDLNMLRGSYGVGLTWISPLGPLTFHYSIPVRSREGDNLDDGFDFSVGGQF